MRRFLMSCMVIERKQRGALQFRRPLRRAHEQPHAAARGHGRGLPARRPLCRPGLRTRLAAPAHLHVHPA